MPKSTKPKKEIKEELPYSKSSSPMIYVTENGELLDLNQVTLNNPFGKEHYDFISKFGISTPLEKFIKELEMIGKSSKDDKSEKREKRLEFFQLCNMSADLNILFQIFSNYLNGGDGVTFQYPSSIVLTVSGGNIFTIFAQLLQNIINHPNEPLFNSTYYVLIQFSQFSEFSRNLQDLIDFIKSIIERIDSLNQNKFKEIINLIASSSYSDFDYKISPNISRLDDSKADALIKEIKQSEQDKKGFLLQRVKSYFKCQLYTSHKEKIDKVYDELPEDVELRKLIDKLHIKLYEPQKETVKKFDCNEKGYKTSDGKTIFDLYPQNMQEEYLFPDPSPSNIYEWKNSDCYKYLSFLLKKKASISENTKFNVEEIINFFINHVLGWKFDQPLYSNMYGFIDWKGPAWVDRWVNNLSDENIIKKLESYTELSSISRTDVIIGYTRLSAISLNYKIMQVIKTDYQGIEYIDWVRQFLTLPSLISSEIPKITSQLIFYFLNNPMFHSEEIIDKLIEDINENSNTKFFTMLDIMMQTDSLQQFKNHQHRINSLQKMKQEFIKLTKRCKILPSKLFFAISSEPYQQPLHSIKQIYIEEKDKIGPGQTEPGTGLPDGTSLTVTAIETAAGSTDNIVIDVDSEDLLVSGGRKTKKIKKNIKHKNPVKPHILRNNKKHKKTKNHKKYKRKTRKL